ncbi:hypothetical protein [Microcystis sp. M42BS1]|uniref:hypothetical protein n=1 Tax=Microcystis sp. M42BS1 TaxID=2771192 RepID=UPI0025892118|nr:hypothetical protein [Microcystis sp. M42BS1]MCA2570705.1 hypothetical protein [Microcystis sp. M42BS1]
METVSWEIFFAIVQFLMGIIMWQYKRAADEANERFSQLKTAMESQQKTLNDVQIHYAQRSELNDMRKEILDRFDRLENKLDNISK